MYHINVEIKPILIIIIMSALARPPPPPYINLSGWPCLQQHINMVYCVVILVYRQNEALC